MLVLVCGMHRSGSTLVWQITRLLLDGQPGLRNPRDIDVSEFAVAAADPDDLLMAKVHYRPTFARTEFPTEGAIYLYTYRDIRDAIASLYRKGRYAVDDERRGVKATRRGTKRELAGGELWTSMPGVWIAKYEDFRDDIPGLVRNLAATLSVAVSDERVAEICREVDIESQKERVQVARVTGVDEDTRITQNHITDGREGAWRDTLTPQEVGAVEIEAGAWLAAHGYTVETQEGRLNIARARRKGAIAGVAASTPAVSAPVKASPAPKPAPKRATPAPKRRRGRAAQAKVLAVILALVSIVSLVLTIALGEQAWARTVFSLVAAGCAGLLGIAVGWFARRRR